MSSENIPHSISSSLHFGRFQCDPQSTKDCQPLVFDVPNNRVAVNSTPQSTISYPTWFSPCLKTLVIPAVLQPEQLSPDLINDNDEPTPIFNPLRPSSTSPLHLIPNAQTPPPFITSILPSNPSDSPWIETGLNMDTPIPSKIAQTSVYPCI